MRECHSIKLFSLFYNHSRKKLVIGDFTPLVKSQPRDGKVQPYGMETQTFNLEVVSCESCGTLISFEYLWNY